MRYISPSGENRSIREHGRRKGKALQSSEQAVRRGWPKMDSTQMTTNDLVVKGKLVNAEQLLAQLFDPDARPSMRWLRSQTKAKAIPYIRIGHLVFFDMEMVRAALGRKNLVRHRMTVPAAA